MLRRTITIALVVLLAAGAASTAGCRRVRIAESPMVTNESKQVPLDGATRILADVKMGVGDLALSGDATTTDALKADFRYEPASLKPEISYSVAGDTGRLRVWQRGLVRDTRITTNTWDLRLAGGVPTELSLEFGVGRSRVDLRNVDVRRLDVLTGVGETTLDLSGPRTDDMDVRIEEGIGELTLRLPRSVGVRVSAREQGIGRTSGEGFNLRGDGWVNEAYSGPGPKIEVELVRGIGNATLELVD